MRSISHKEDTPFRLHLGCGDRHLSGFINIDTIPGADLRLDVRRGLPFTDESCEFVFSEHFIEHLNRREGLRLLREIRRVLQPGGIVRLATPDLAAMIEDYGLQRIPEDWQRFGLSWAKTRCERLNIGMREWGHQWLYDQEELQRVAELAGLSFTGRCQIGESCYEALCNLEHRSGSRLILEFSKPDRCLAVAAIPLVSIAIPAFRSRYFEKALSSAINQTWRHLEIIVSDDCPDNGIEEIVKKFSGDSRIRYIRNRYPVDGGHSNLIHCFEISQGEFIKFLNDDDVLTADCVERLLDCFRKYPDVTLAFSKRTLIDGQDNILPDRAFNFPPSLEDRVFDGPSLAAGVIGANNNFIGEPTTVLFRKNELASVKPGFMSFAGYDWIRAVNDLATWFNLLSAGNAAYVASPLSCFRLHAEQNQNSPECYELSKVNLPLLSEGAYRLGLVGPEPEIAFSKVTTMDNHPAYLKAAIEDLTRLAEQKDCSWMVYDRLGDYAEKMGDKALARSLYKQANEKAGVPVLENLKWAKLLIGADRYAELIPLLERFLERFSDSADVDIANVREWLEMARTACQSFPDARETMSDSSISSLSDYWQWTERRRDDALFETLHRERVERLWPRRFVFEILLILEPGQEDLLADTIDSLSQQYYDGWRLGVFAQTASPEAEFTKAGSPVRWFQCASVEDIDQHLAESPAHWFGLFACGTRFAPELFLTLGDYLAIRPQWRLIYTDEDAVGKNGKVHSPLFKPDFNLEFLRSTDYIGGFCVEKDTLISAGGFSAIPGAERYDLLLRAIDAVEETAIGHIPEVLTHFPGALSRSIGSEGAAQALYNHFERRKIPVDITQGLIEGETRRVVYLHEKTPKVSIIIPTRNRLDLLSACVETLFKNTSYPDFELLIADNDSDDPNVGVYYEKLCALLPERVRILHVGGEFDFSAMNNRAARQARGEYLLLLNNDTECIHNDWLDVMMSHAQRPDVGIVGARLLFPKTLRIQHAGMVLGIDQRAEHVFTHLTYDAPGYMNRALVDQEYSAVTGACLLIRTAIFHAVAGLDATLKTLCQDVDLCLKVKELGYRVIWTPSATLLHHASATLGRKPDAQKSAIIQLEYKESLARWKHRFTNDPAWNRNLSLGLRNVIPSLEKELVIPWNPDFHDRPRILAMPATGHGTVEYRLAGPLRALNAQGRLHYAVVCQPRHDEAQFAPHSVELDRLAPDVLLLDTPVDDIRCLALLSCKEWNPEIFRVCLLDDLITMVPESNPMYAKLPSDKITDRLRFVLNTCHRLIVSTAPLAEAYRGMIDDIRIVPNALEWKIWGGLQSQRRRGKKLRVGWAGAQQHAGDLRLVLDVVKATHKEVDWIFLGMLPEGAKPYVTEFHDYVHHLADYPAKLASLDLDLAIAPLETHPFNEAKSNLRLLEYGILGWPVICTDIFPYQTGNPPVTRLPNNADQWITAIRERIGEADSLAREGDALREWVKRHYLLKNRLDQWLSAVTKA